MIRFPHRAAPRTCAGLIGLLALLAPGSPAQGVTIDIPADYASIGEGLAVAVPEDTLRVAPGYYQEHDLELVSRVTLLGATDNPDDVIIDAALQGRVLYGASLEAGTLIRGLTLINGRSGPDDTPAAEGAGIYLNGSVLAIRRCLIGGNIANRNSGSSLGGGVSCRQSSHVLFEDCVISENAAEGGTGGAIYVDTSSSVLLVACELGYNEALPDWPNAGGVGGIRGQSELEDCTFHHNHGESVGAVSGASRVESCVFYANVAEGNNQGGFGSCGALVCTSSTLLRNCTFVANEADITAAVSSTPLPLLDHCLLTRNVGWKTVTNSVDEPPVCTNFFENDDGNWEGVLSPYLGSDGNISADPLFCGETGSGDFTLKSDSPCAPGHHPDGGDCGLIGALPVACAGTPTRAASWSGVKSLY